MKPLLIKVCGLTREQDLKFCRDLGIDMTGVIFHPESPRYVSPDLAGTWEKEKELRVGVFVDQDKEEIVDIIDRAGLDMVQLHGGQGPEICQAVGPDRVIRAFWPDSFDRVEDFLEEIDRFKDVCRYFLFDAGKAGGGHGKNIGCEWLDKIKSPRPYLLAGGLGPDNVSRMLDLDMAGFDLNSGVESAPGRKDQEKIRQVLSRVRC
ncbi:MAG: phosphoribosylanthranilate isomerase [Desulfonatronovibrio sp.]